MQCGDFYEAIGIDAVLLVQFAGLNPMGNRSPPRAGCPKQNIRRVLADLVENAALSVVRSATIYFTVIFQRKLLWVWVA